MLAAAALLFVHVSAPLDAASWGIAYTLDAAQVARPDAASSISGTVRDSAGGVISGASIVIRGGARDQQVATGPEGRFSVPAPPSGDVLLIVRAAGFAELQYTVAREAPRANLDLVVVPAHYHGGRDGHRTRSERRTGDVPASVSMLDRQDIKQSPALVADDVLRQIPTFSSSAGEQPGIASHHTGRVAARYRAKRRQPHACAR